MTLKVYARWLQTIRVDGGSIGWMRRNHPQPPRNLRGKLRSVEIL